MIANVATHPEYRGRGIARALTMTALDHARYHNAVATWLQVRDDNPDAIHIYKTCGFEEPSGGPAGIVDQVGVYPSRYHRWKTLLRTLVPCSVIG